MIRLLSYFFLASSDSMACMHIDQGLFASTGMRVGALSGLRIGDIKKFEEHILYLIWVYNNSRKDRYYTFCSVECAHAIDDYLAYRNIAKIRRGNQRFQSFIRNKVTADNPFVIKAPKSIKVRSIQLIVKKLQKKQELC
jgi:site-specific recombinase XerD